ncbi:inorganic phosphate transporter [Phenylobacterium sp.]|uniref:inorganic phosphate transporter n=1 Tax=Phenylobacterium sp. TaxID=1871053 RepID=UPI0035B378A9
MRKTTLDKDLKKVGRLQAATAELSRQLAMPSLAGVFLLAVGVFATVGAAHGPLGVYLIFGALVAGYLALNIGANDVANNMGPAVGGKALSMVAALAIAAVCETAGAVLAGGDVVSTISKGIITPPAGMAATDFIKVMMAALFCAAVWINLATVLGAPVSTTHAIVGAVLGAAIAAVGPDVVAWPVIGEIVASWVISPLMGAVIAAAMLAFIKWAILFREDRVTAARRWVPFLMALMAGVFALYLLTKGLQRIWRPSDATTWVLTCLAFAAAWGGAVPWVRARSHGMENRRKDVSGLFVPPLIVAAGLLSFAHGANDVANAAGPLAAIAAAVESGATAQAQVALPMWILVIGALGISLGLALFGPRLIRTVGEQITKMDSMRAYCVALSAAVTVLTASAMGLPVSSTHIAVGGVFGVGLLREALTNRGLRRRAAASAPVPLRASETNLTPEDALRRLVKREKRRLVRRRHAWSIAAAWVVTVPASALLAGLLYLGLNLVIGR